MATVIDSNGKVVIITSSLKTARAVQKHGLRVVAPKKKMVVEKKRYVVL